jgi:hypothetical protein
MAIVTKVRFLREDSPQPTLVFHRAEGEGMRAPSDVVSLLRAEGLETGTLRARNPITHDHWWIPIIKEAAPYAIALGAVIRSWLKERKGRQVKLENGRFKITANTPADIERLLRALTKHERNLGPVQVTKAASRKASAKPAGRKLSGK